MAKEIGCSVEGCARPFHARSLCKVHHKSAMHNGSITKKKLIIDSIQELTHYCPTTGCWLWAGPSDRNGYGYVIVSGKRVSAHRFVKGVSDPAIHVLHSCDTPGCINPDHLFIGDHTSNMADMKKKGRHFRPIGEVHPKAKINNRTAIAAREMLKAGSSRADIAHEIGLGYRSTCLLLQGKTWKGVE